MADELAATFPKSARIAVVRARLEGKVELARKAVSLDPSYDPAQVALASTLLAAGEVAAARAAIERVKDLRGLDDGYAVLARVKWAEGDVAGAKEAATQELTGGRRAHAIEPGGAPAAALAQAHEVLGLFHLKAHEQEKAVPHLLEAEPYSKQVQQLLKTPDPDLRKALARRKRPKMPPGGM
jgi:predicted Zn-dependent protease